MAGLHAPSWCDPAWLDFPGIAFARPDEAGANGMGEVANLLGESGRTYPAFSPALALDKMFVRDMKPVEWITPTQDTAWLSDHLPYMAKLRLE